METVPRHSRHTASPPVVYPKLRKRYRRERDRIGPRGVPGRGAAAGRAAAGRVRRDRAVRGAGGDRAVADLGAEGLAADVTMLNGNGYVPGHAELALDLVRTDPGVRMLFDARLAAD